MSAKKVDIVHLEENDIDAHGIASKTSALGVAFNIMKTIIGAGIFATPYALNNCGFVFGLILILGMGVVFYWSIMTLVRASEVSGAKDIQTLIRHCFGKGGEVALNVSLVFIAWGAMASYTIIVGDVLPKVLRAVVGTPDSEIARTFLSRRMLVILSSVIIMLPVSMAKSLAGLAKFSGFALAAILTIIGCVLGVAPGLNATWKGDTAAVLPLIKPEGITGAIGVFCFAYVCQHNILLNYQSLKNNTVARFAPVARVSIATTVTLTIAIGMAFLTFREKSASNILESFPPDNTVMNVCRFLFALDMFFTYPLELFIARDTVERSVFKGRDFSLLRHAIITLFLLGTTTVVGTTICNLGIVLELTGGVAAAIIAFIVPCSCWLKSNELQGNRLSLLQKLPHIVCVAFGFALMVLTIVMSVLSQINATETADCHWN